ncbi:cytochrome c [uncultured Paracoccus sp.]|uniref:c-type cytochrome n=1 Tax=uncultured Paracoccus sp. TaxID=189685 RepID=UPI0026057655|nr:cytochrome c [uncultured Paracoccus sp.]
MWRVNRTSEKLVTAEAVIALGRGLYDENCASCHGANLQGQPDWKIPLENGRYPAPPHDATGHTWHHADALLEQIIRDGSAAVVGNGYESDMPGFGDILSDDQIAAVLAYIKSTWPERERAIQTRVTEDSTE